MSAGAFTLTRYEDDKGNIHPIRVQPETITMSLGAGSNSPPADPVDTESYVRATGGKRRYGILARRVALAWTAAPPAGYKAGSLVVVPILSSALWNTLIEGVTTGSYLGSNVVVVGLRSQAGRGG